MNRLSEPLLKPWARPWAGLGRSKNAVGYSREAPKIPKERQIQWTLCALGGSLGRTSPAQGSLETPSDPFHQGFAQGFLSGKALGKPWAPWAAQGKLQENALGGLGDICFRSKSFSIRCCARLFPNACEIWQSYQISDFIVIN